MKLGEQVSIVVVSTTYPLRELPVKLAALLKHLESIAPLATAESWDNVGLLWGDSDGEISQIMTCLTLTPDVADEAIQAGAQLVVTHHPLLFKPVQRVTTETTEGGMLWRLARAGVAVYTPHTAWDNAPDGINAWLARTLGLTDVQPLRPFDDPSRGAGRYGALSQPQSLTALVDHVRKALDSPRIEFVGDPKRTIQTLGIACGSAAEFWKDAERQGCDALLTGETRFHGALEVRAADFPLILAGHYATERPGMEHLSHLLQQAFPELTVWCSRCERDPLQAR